jgi:hypothetical protein
MSRPVAAGGAPAASRPRGEPGPYGYLPTAPARLL